MILCPSPFKFCLSTQKKKFQTIFANVVFDLLLIWRRIVGILNFRWTFQGPYSIKLYTHSTTTMNVFTCHFVFEQTIRQHISRQALGKHFHLHINNNLRYRIATVILSSKIVILILYRVLEIYILNTTNSITVYRRIYKATRAYLNTFWI